MLDVILWSNGNVMVFDENGMQMPEYQDIFRKAREKLKKVADNIDTIRFGFWDSGIIIPMSKSHFFCICWD